MTELSTLQFVTDYLKAMDESEGTRRMYKAGALQVVRYEAKERHDAQHDGFDRFLTILTYYLNGAVGTWFPYAVVDDEEPFEELQHEAPDMRSETVASDRTPSNDGLLIVSMDDLKELGENVVKVEPGDAVLFYNYDWIENLSPKVTQPHPQICHQPVHKSLAIDS